MLLIIAIGFSTRFCEISIKYKGEWEKSLKMNIIDHTPTIYKHRFENLLTLNVKTVEKLNDRFIQPYGIKDVSTSMELVRKNNRG